MQDFEQQVGLVLKKDSPIEEYEVQRLPESVKYIDKGGCLVVDDSSYTRHYYTFGDKTLSGDLFIKVGIPNNKEVKFSNLKVSFRDSDK